MSWGNFSVKQKVQHTCTFPSVNQATFTNKSAQGRRSREKHTNITSQLDIPVFP